MSMRMRRSAREIGYDKRRPVASNDTESRRAQNRRGELRVIAPDVGIGAISRAGKANFRPPDWPSAAVKDVDFRIGGT